MATRTVDDIAGLAKFDTGLLTNFIAPLNRTMNFNAMFKVAPTAGNLVYEYNPFRNFRLDRDMFEYQGHLYTLDELNDMGISASGDTWFINGAPMPSDGDIPLLMQAGVLADFETDQLQFDINHPVDVLPQYSYDGSVNLILNDGKNIPRLINSRFTSLGRNTYKVMDRKGDNDTNIYDQGTQFDIDTSLYKRVVEIPELDFISISSGGNLKVGNYVFYFRYADADGNETDFVAESGIVSCFIGTELNSITGGQQDENTYKMVRFVMRNIDASYSYVIAYYTRTTSAESGEVIETAHRIDYKYEVSKALTCQINITGFEPKENIPLEAINIRYCIASSVWTQATCQNRLFLGNIHRPDINYKELNDLSLRFCPTIYKKTGYNLPSFDYSESTKNTYSDPNFIYNYTGYANGGEVYAFGIVYILADNTLSPTFYTRGAIDVNTEYNYSNINVYTSQGKRIYISSEESTGEIIAMKETGENAPSYTIENDNIQNVWGIVSIEVPVEGGDNDSNTIYGIKMNVDDRVNVFKALAELGIKGFFFVRQKRIPLTICQALTIGVDKYSYTPVLPVSPTVMKEYFPDNENISDGKACFIAERFLNDDRIIDHDFVDRLYILNRNSVFRKAAICPNFDTDVGYYNQVFNGSEFYACEANFQPENEYLSIDQTDNRHMYVSPVSNTKYKTGSNQQTAVITVNDSAPVVATSKSTWRGVAGTAEEAFRFEYLERDNRVDDASNMVRGVFGNYIGIDGMERDCSIINIKSPEAVNASIYDIMATRHSDKLPYYAISKRYALKNFISVNEDGSYDSVDDRTFESEMGILYRGDSFICMFTHRFNRNFADPEAPNNDKIVDENTWVDNYKAKETDDYNKINRGDINAVKMGMWVTFPVVSYRNLNIRSLDHSYPEEEGLTGHARGFYPYYSDSVEGSFKIPESMFINQGLSVNLGERWNMPVPDVPYIKNDFQTRILYSNKHINDAFENGFRVFEALNFQDYPRTYGEIVRLVELNNALICVFEHGIMRIEVNERTLSGSGANGDVFVNTEKILPEHPLVISDTFGTQWAESVIKTPYGVYGVDTVGKKIWRTDGSRFQIISDFAIQEFLNLNISLTERELTPIIGIRNVKSHYNHFKQDVMFTFYDNTVGFEEKVWNICFNELLDCFVTFYSWLPSYSQNIDNIYFSFDRNTSKWIGKLGISHAGNSFAEGIVLTNNIMTGTGRIGELSLVNIELPSINTGVSVSYTFTLEHDNFGNYKMFSITGNTLYLNAGVDYSSLVANIFKYDTQTGRRVFLDRNDPNFRDTIVYELNIRCKVVLSYNGDDYNIKQHVNEWNEYQKLDAGYYDYSVAVIPQENIQYLTTDFWKHGQAGIIDIADKILPTEWYARRHPFEFEFIVADDTSLHKVFEALEIIGNAAEPESFHYEIVGDVYDFAEEKLNIYYRQEAIKALYQYNGSDILYDHDFTKLIPKQRIVTDEYGQYVKKATIFPLYYSRNDMFNYIEDYYRQLTSPNKDYVNLSGSEILHYDNEGEFRIWTHIKGTNIKYKGRLRGNMWYNEDMWYVQIPSINVIEKNEDVWPSSTKTYIDDDGTNKTIGKLPLPVLNSPVPNDILNTNITDNDFPAELTELGYGTSDIDLSEWSGNYNDSASMREETKVRDKYVKIRIRYDGSSKVIIQAVRTMYSVSYC